jgi:hypothetical protein
MLWHLATVLVTVVDASPAPWEPTAGLPAGSNPAADPSAIVRCDGAY